MDPTRESAPHVDSSSHAYNTPETMRNAHENVENASNSRMTPVHSTAAHRIPIALRCSDIFVSRVRYAFDTLFQAVGIQCRFVDDVPADGFCIAYGSGRPSSRAAPVLSIVHAPQAWEVSDPSQWLHFDGLPVPPPLTLDGDSQCIPFDLAAAAFYFLTCAFERGRPAVGSRSLFSDSVYAKDGVPQDIVDRYVSVLLDRVVREAGSHGDALRPFSVVLSHDVDFLPSGLPDNLLQGAKTLARHGLRQRNPLQAIRAGAGLASALFRGRDPYGCVPEIIAAETARGVRSSFQVAVARRHAADVNYDIRDDRTRDYLRAIPDAGFDLCLHGSYRSTERREWYKEEVALLTERLGRPLGSRQHFLSFDYDTLFHAQEASGIRYDMSIGFPDRCGPRAGFSYPYFPYCLAEDRPYDVLEIPLTIMDVTLQSYMKLAPRQAEALIDAELEALRRKRGAVSVVWHPIVFGGARDPGYADVYWHLVDRVKALGGLATDGHTLNEQWRAAARSHASFANLLS